MTITPEQRAMRSKHLGSSDAAAVLGVDPWKSQKTLFLEKTRDLEPDDKPTEAMQWGNRFESVAIALAEERLGGPLLRSSVAPGPGPMFANLDAGIMTRACIEPVEVKWQSSAAGWGDEDQGIDGVPINYAIQSFHQIICTRAKRGFVGAILPGFRMPTFRLYEIVPDADMLERLEAAFLAWWSRHIVANVMPSDDAPVDVEVLQRIRREPGSSTTLAAEVFQRFTIAREKALLAEDELKSARDSLLLALDTAEQGVSDAGTVTYMQRGRTGLDANALAIAHPDIAAQFKRTTSYRALVVKPKKETT